MNRTQTRKQAQSLKKSRKGKQMHKLGHTMH